MRRLAPLVLVLVGCAGSPPPAAEPPTVPAATPPPDLPMQQARACIAAASTEPFAQFVSPVPGRGFREHFARRVSELGCCFTEERRRSIAGVTQLRVELVADGDDPADGAHGRLRAPIDPGRPVEEGCLREIVEAWHMPHAPVSDVIRAPLDPRISTRSSAASVMLSYPL